MREIKRRQFSDKTDVCSVLSAKDFFKKLKKYFNDIKVPPEQRKSQFLVTCGKQVLWLVGGKAAGWHEQEQGCEAWLTLDIKYFSLGDDK